MDAQTVIVGIALALAAFYLVRKLARSAQGRPDGGCDKCSCGDHAPAKNLK